jgi:hypothetical protein
MNLKSKTVCWVDNGLFASFARKVAPEFGKVLYYTPWQEPFPKSIRVEVGDGFPEIERIQYPLARADEIDLWIFTDLFQSDLQVYLAGHGARVWGARYGEELELERWQMRQLLTKLGLPVAQGELVQGMPALRKYLASHNNVFVKTSFSRGDMETWHHSRMDVSEPRLAEMDYNFGPFAQDYQFIVEAEIPDAVEIGYDGFTIDGQFPTAAMMAYEIKDCGMIGTVKAYGDLADPVRLVNSKLAPALKGYNYRGFLSTEIRYTKDRKPYLIDPCCRLGLPSNELLQELIGNWGEIFWNGAEGKLAAPKQIAKFGVVAMVHGKRSGRRWQSLHYPKVIDQWVKLINPVAIGGRRYSAPEGLPTESSSMPGNVASVVGVGNTVLEAVKACADHAKQIEGDSIEIHLSSIDKALETIAAGEKMGIKFSDELPTAEELKKAVGS